MNYIKSLVGALAALAVSSCLFGQNAESSAGLLGFRYVGAGVSVEDFRGDLSPLANGVGPDLVVNLPVKSNLDVAFSYGYEHSSRSSLKLREHSVGATVRAYNPYEGVKLFSDATLGYAWTRLRAPAANLSENDAFWSLGVGVEAPVAAATSLIGRVAYVDGFSGDTDGSWTFTGGVNHWFTSKVFGLASVTFVENDSVVYSLGGGLRF